MWMKQPMVSKIFKLSLMGCGTFVVLVIALVSWISFALFSGPDAMDTSSPFHPFRSEKAKAQYLTHYDQRAKTWKRCHPLEGACQVGRAILETRNGILAVEGRWIFRMHLLFVAVWPDSHLSWCQSTTAPATHQDQGDEGLRTRSPAPGANRRPRKSSSSAG